MDVSTAAQPTGLLGWVMANGQLVLFFAQLLFWFFMVLFAGYAVFQYKRWVNFTLGIGKSGHLRTGDDSHEDAKPVREPKAADTYDDVSVEEFVE